MSSGSQFYSFKPKNSKSPASSPNYPKPSPLAPPNRGPPFNNPPESGEEVNLENYRDRVVLVVNTASKCGFTGQYEGLEKLYKKLKPNHPGFEIVAFPCNQFSNQEPGTDEEIQNFCQVNYGVSFPVMKKVEVNGDGADPLWKWLTAEKPGVLGIKRVKWNFEKFLVGKDGKVVGRWASTTKPDALEQPILDALAVDP